MESCSLLVRFHKPQPLVYAARDLGEDVGAARVLELVHLLDAEPHRAAEAGERVRQRRDVLRAGGERQRIVNEGRPPLHDAHRPLGDAAELDDPLGDQRSEEHTSELQSLAYLVCRLLLEKKKKSSIKKHQTTTRYQ